MVRDIKLDYLFEKIIFVAPISCTSFSNSLILNQSERIKLFFEKENDPNEYVDRCELQYWAENRAV